METLTAQTIGKSSRLEGLAAIGRTPLVHVALRIDGAWRSVALKLESFNPAGSIKDRTAYALLRSLEARNEVRPGDQVIESTSGNLGVALAMICRERGYAFSAVVDPKPDPVVLDKMRAYGAKVIRVEAPDHTGGYLLTRLSEVRRRVDDEHLVWPNQYGNPANPRIHYQQTAPEIRRHQPDIDAIFVAASTGGTLSGVGRYFKAVRPQVRVVGVDIPGSRVFGTTQAARILNGIGSSCESQFLRPGDHDDVVIVRDRDAVAACHMLVESTGIGVGGSSGAVLHACAEYLGEHPEIRRPVCICADGSANYLNTVYGTGWLDKHGFCPASDMRSLRFDEVRWQR